MKIKVKDFEAGGYYADLEVEGIYDKGDPQTGVSPGWEFEISAWRNTVVNSRGNRRSSPEWRVPPWKLEQKLLDHFGRWFHNLSNESQEKLM